MGIGGSVLSILTQFLSINHSKLWSTVVGVNWLIVSRVPQGSVFDPLLFLLYTSDLFTILGNKLIGYADDSTFMINK